MWLLVSDGSGMFLSVFFIFYTLFITQQERINSTLSRRLAKMTFFNLVDANYRILTKANRAPVIFQCAQFTSPPYNPNYSHDRSLLILFMNRHTMPSRSGDEQQSRGTCLMRQVPHAPSAFCSFAFHSWK